MRYISRLLANIIIYGGVVVGLLLRLIIIIQGRLRGANPREVILHIIHKTGDPVKTKQTDIKNKYRRKFIIVWHHFSKSHCGKRPSSFDGLNLNSVLSLRRPRSIRNIPAT